MDFGQRLKVLLKNSDMTQKEFAERIEMNYAHVNKFFVGRKPNMPFLEKVLTIFPDVNLNWLLFDQEGHTKNHLLNEEGAPYSMSNALTYLDEIEDKLSKLRITLTQK